MFVNTIIYSQSLSNVSISSNYEVGCQEFQNIDDPRFKEPVLLESIQDSDCIKVCELTTVIYTLNNLPNTGVSTQWIVVGGTIVVAPNPASESVTIQYSNLPNQAVVYVYDLQGKELKTYNLLTTSDAIELDTHAFAAGVYIIVTKHNGAIINQQKLIIK